MEPANPHRDAIRSARQFRLLDQDVGERRGYKRYLEPNSDDQVPSSSYYRHRKQRAGPVTARSSQEYGGGVTEITSANEKSAEDETCRTNRTTETQPLRVFQNTAWENTPSKDIQDSTEIDPSTSDAAAINKDLPTHVEVGEIVHGSHDSASEIDDEDHFMDAIDCLDPLEEDDTRDHHLLQGYACLQHAIDDKALEQPIKNRVNKTVGEVLWMIVKFVIVHSLSLTETTDLFKLINSMFDEPFLCDTRYSIDKLFYPKNCMSLHGTCSECGAGIGKFDQKDRYLECKSCHYNIDLTDYSYKNFFAMMDMATPISKLLESNSEYYSAVVNHPIVRGDMLRDIYDGDKYREFVGKLSESDRNRYATVTFNTDGAPLFESSSYSIWPIFVMLNEVPFHVRSKELILAGLWFGKDKPNMGVFLDQFVSNMNDLSSNGVQCNINGNKTIIKIFPLVCCVDAVARAPVQGITQFNGSFGCGQCLHPGEWVRANESNPRSGSMKYPLQDTVSARRDMQQTILHMRQVAESNRPVYGVKSASPLINLVYFDLIDGTVVDSLHCFTGIAKQFVKIWFGDKQRAGLLPRAVTQNIDTLLNNIKAPHQVARLTRSFSENAFWKAREWENWTIYYSLPILKDVLPVDWFKHWACFVHAFHILSQSAISIQEVNIAETLLYDFVGRTEILYGKTAMTFNVHSLLHVAKSVSDWGPLWSHNTYAFESGNGALLKVIHAAKGIHHQICRRISSTYSLLTLNDHVIPYCSPVVLNYCKTIGKSIAAQTLSLNKIRYFGSGSKVNALWLHRLHMAEHSVAYTKIVKDGCLYASSTRKNQRSDNSYVTLKDKSFARVVRFIVDPATQQQYSIVKKIQTANAFETACSMIQRIINTDNDESAILTSDVEKICVHITVGDNEYVCGVPNLYYY